MNIPDQYQPIMPYLILQNASGFFAFMEKVFGASQKLLKLRAGTDLIQHAELIVNDCCIMYAEATKEWPVQNAGLFIYVADAAACFQLAVENGAKIIQPLATMEYGDSGGVTDPFGNTWWITSVV